jgi:hypothetical protein
MDAKQAALNAIQQKLNPAMGYETGYGDAVRQADLEAGSTQQQDQAQADLIVSGVDGETAEAAASVLAQEAIDPGERRSFAEQHVVMEAYVQLQQALQEGEPEERNLEAQQERVAIVAPIVVAAMNGMATHELEGERYGARFDSETQVLTVAESGEKEPIVVAQWDGVEWRDRGSKLSEGQVAFFRQEMQPQVEKMIGQRQRDEGFSFREASSKELWIEVE